MSKKLCTRNNIIVTGETEGVLESESEQNENSFDTSGDFRSVKSLMDHCITYIAKNAHFVESFWGFPDDIGERIFTTALTLGTFTNANSRLADALHAFCDAYGSTVLETLSLSGQHLVLNNYLEPIFLFTELSKLDISSCGLGDGHEILHHISKLQSLKTLSVRGNALTDEGLRKLTAPIRMFQQGPRTLKYLDLSDNQLTDKGVRHLMCFSHLEIVNLTANKIKSYSILEARGLHISSTASELCRDIFLQETKGWAAPLISAWCEEQAAKSQGKKVRKTTFYGKPQECASSQSSIVSSKPVYSHVLVSDSYLNTNKKSQLSYKAVEKETDSSAGTSDSKIGRHVHPVTLKTAEVCVNAIKQKVLDNPEDDLMKLYGGYSGTADKTATLADVLSESW